jgi:arylsulfatase A-like enzyme
MTGVLIAAFDGLLPQQVTPDLTPTIHRLASEGVKFTRHHAVYPTVTRANSATMVTGCYPGKHGIPANLAVFADHDPYTAMNVLQPELDAMTATSGTPVLFVPTIGELLAESGLTHVSIVGGTSGNAYAHFPRAAETGRGGVIHPEFSLPSDLGKAESDVLGPWPAKSVPAIERVRRVAESACKFVIPEINPDLLFVWFPEPDTANHAHGIGSEQSNMGLLEADAGLARILDMLSKQGDDPDVLIISDHGYSTISNTVDIAEQLQASGFETNAGAGSLIVGTNGGSVLLDYPGAADADIKSLAIWLNRQPWAGAVFSSLEDTAEPSFLSASVARIDGRRAPHFAVSMSWTDDSAARGFTGTAWNSGLTSIGAGMHGSASRHEIRNTLIASGPSFKQRVISNVPSGNVDVTPTALSLLGQPVPTHMDGRVLDEALRNGPDQAEITVESNEISGSVFKTGAGTNELSRYLARTVKAAGRTYMESAGRAPG